MKPFQRNEIEINPKNEAEYRRLADALEMTKDLVERVRLLGQFDGICRTIGKYKEAITAHEEAANLIRLATVMHY